MAVLVKCQGPEKLNIQHPTLNIGLKVKAGRDFKPEVPAKPMPNVVNIGIFRGLKISAQRRDYGRGKPLRPLLIVEPAYELHLSFERYTEICFYLFFNQPDQRVYIGRGGGSRVHYKSCVLGAYPGAPDFFSF